MIIKGIQKLTLIDFPGVVACTIFLFGCNFRCPYCQNPELVVGPEEPGIGIDEVLRFLKRRKSLIEGVCISGGEPTTNKDLPDFIQKIKELGFEVKLDTNGSNPSMIAKLIERRLLDYIAMDIKAPPSKYHILAGTKVNMWAIERSVEMIKSSNVDYEFRITIPPGFFTSKDFIEIGRWLEGSKKVYIQEFNPVRVLDKRLEGLRVPRKELLRYHDILKRFVDLCRVRFLDFQGRSNRL